MSRREREMKGLRGGVRRYAAQASPKIDARMGGKEPFPDGNNTATLCFLQFNLSFPGKLVMIQYFDKMVKGTKTRRFPGNPSKSEGDGRDEFLPF